MKLTFEGKTMRDVLEQMQDTLGIADFLREAIQKDQEATAPEAIAPEVIAVVDKPVEKPVDKMAKARAARGKSKAAAPAKPAPAPEPEAEPEPFGEVDPAEMVKMRQKTLEELQTAYADGHHKEVLTLLSVHGNGAKSFRELPPEAFIPIREAIDLGALTTKAPA